MSTKRWTSIVAGLVLALLFAGCAVTMPSGDIVEVSTEEWALAASAEADAAPELVAAEPEPVLFSLLLLSEGEPLRAQEIFAQVSPAVAYIATPHSTGSAVLVDLRLSGQRRPCGLAL